jgi:serine/threonine-protein kinase
VAFELPGYTVVSTLGRGAKTSILEVADLKTGEIWALKRVIKRSSEDNRFLEQVENEHRISSQVDHPALRKCGELIRVRKWMRVSELLLFMEFINGTTLEYEKPESVPQTIEFLAQIAEGIQALHEAGFVHADIKPNNILRAGNGRVKLIDLGQSCKIGHIKERIQGTPDYIAPEQVRRSPIDQRTDVFNFGATLYWLLTRRAIPTLIASKGRTGIDLAGPKDAPAPHEVNKDVPTALSKLVMECCLERPQDRPQNMKQVIARMEIARDMIRRRSRDKGQSASEKSATPGHPQPSSASTK